MTQVDFDTIIPGMRAVLSYASQYIEDIDALLRAGHEMAALELRLLARRRIRKLHENMRVVFDQMNQMASYLDRSSSGAASTSSAR